MRFSPVWREPSSVHERGSKCLDECLGLFERRIVSGRLDHVKRPSVTRARGFRSCKTCCEVVPAPDQRRFGLDARELLARNRGNSELLHELLLLSRKALVSGAIEVVSLEALPGLAEPSSHAIEIEGAASPDAVMSFGGRPHHVLGQRSHELRSGLERR